MEGIYENCKISKVSMHFRAYAEGPFISVDEFYIYFFFLRILGLTEKPRVETQGSYNYIYIIYKDNFRSSFVMLKS